jgi:ABC-type enterochelin transport system ATPase subunit
MGAVWIVRIIVPVINDIHFAAVFKDCVVAPAGQTVG